LINRALETFPAARRGRGSFSGELFRHHFPAVTTKGVTNLVPVTIIASEPTRSILSMVQIRACLEIHRHPGGQKAIECVGLDRAIKRPLDSGGSGLCSLAHAMSQL
jgi:hypothetical protein